METGPAALLFEHHTPAIIQGCLSSRECEQSMIKLEFALDDRRLTLSPSKICSKVWYDLFGFYPSTVRAEADLCIASKEMRNSVTLTIF